MVIIWTKRLALAALAVSQDKTPLPYRDALLRDVRYRAAEFATRQPVGYVMSALQQEYFQCLRSRLESEKLPSHAELRAAWAEAWDEAMSDAACDRAAAKRRPSCLRERW